MINEAAVVAQATPEAGSLSPGAGAAQFDALLNADAAGSHASSSLDRYVLDEATISSRADNQLLKLSDQLERIVDSASREIRPGPGANLDETARVSIDIANQVLQAQSEIVRLSLLMETTSSSKQSLQTLFNMQQ